METFEELIGKRIEERRLAAGFATQTELADELKIDRARVSDWETGKRKPRGRNKKRLLEIFKCSENELFGLPRANAPPSPPPLDVFSPEIRKLILAWRRAPEQWQRDFALFVLTGKYEHLMKVSPEVRKRLEKALRLFGLSPPSQPSKK